MVAKQHSNTNMTVQGSKIHKKDSQVRIFSRRLTDVTQSLPEIAEIVRKNVKASKAILEGEVVAVDIYGTPIPFQHLMRRFKRVQQSARYGRENSFKTLLI